MRRRVSKSPQSPIAECPLYGISPLLLAETFAMDAERAAIWKAELRRAPERARKIQLLVNRDLGAFDPRWTGFRVLGDELCIPDGYGVRQGEIRALPYFHSLLAAERAALRAAERQLAERNPIADETARLHLEQLLSDALDTVRGR